VKEILTDFGKSLDDVSFELAMALMVAHITQEMSTLLTYGSMSVAPSTFGGIPLRLTDKGGTV
jgi:hypothetical protein